MDVTTITVEINDFTRTAEARFEARSGVEPYRVYVEHDDDDSETPWCVNDTGDADRVCYDNWAEAVAYFRQTVAYEFTTFNAA